MKIGVIIVTYNAVKWIDKCIKPLSEVTEGNKVYIIDNGSTDGTQEIIKTKFPQFIFHESKENLGFGKANNLGLKIALDDGVDYFFLLNQDAHVSWSNIHQLALILSKNPDYGILSPLQMFSDNAVDYLHYKTLLQSNTSFFNDLISKNELKNVYEIEYTNAAIWMISKKCLELVGGFDPIFPHYGEDHEYANRLQSFNLKFGLCPSVLGYHYRVQNQKRKKTKIFFFNYYLIELKNLKQNLIVVYIKIIFRSLFSFLANSKEAKSLSSKESFGAILELLFIYRKIKFNKKINFIEKFSFIKYK
jgi:GT2 family glycosyltransferase